MSAPTDEHPTRTKDAASVGAAAAPSSRPVRTFGRGLQAATALLVAIVGAVVFHGKQTLTVARSDLTDLQLSLNDLRDWFDGQRDSNPVLQALDGVRAALDSLITTLQGFLSEAAFPRPVPEIGWLGVIALAVWVVYAVSGVKMAILTAAAFASFGLFGYWQDSIDTLIITFVSVILVLIIGIPLGMWMGRSSRATAVVTPLLDVLQTFPSFVYLLPITLVFGIGAAPAVIATAIYALPPVVRITAHGIRTVSTATIEATTSLGSSRGQILRKVQLPMAKRTIIVGINQSIMAALSMVTIAAFIDSPGLGGPVITALQSLDVGTSFAAGVLVVVMAIMLDRVTTAAGERTGLMRTAVQIKRRRLIVAGSFVLAVVAVVLSRQRLALAEFPDEPNFGRPIADGAQSAADWVTDNLAGVTSTISEFVSTVLLNPLQSFLAESPWWLIGGLLIVLAAIISGWRSAVTALVSVAVILGVGVWHEAMNTLATTLVAIVIVMVLALVLGVLMAQSTRLDTILRPMLDAGQTVPALVYLVPAVALFGATRFTAIVAAIIYAAPVAIKLVCDAVQGVAPTSVEAARAAGSSRWQLITKVQLPMARSGIALAVNQGMLYVFAVVVIGGLVGAGGLGYLVVAGFSRGELYGKGLAAGIAIVALAIMLDRMAQGYNRNNSDPTKTTQQRTAVGPAG